MSSKRAIGRPCRVAIFGSCVSRDPFGFLAPSWAAVTSYLARQSFVGIGDPPLAFDEAWYDGLDGFERRCVIADLTKRSDLYWSFEQDADVLIVDYVDERFDILQIGETAISKAHTFRPGLRERYGDRINILPRMAEETTQRWSAGAKRFFERALDSFPPERIVLHEAQWASSFKTPDGELTPFGPPYAARIAPVNALLRRYHETTKALVPGISSVKVPTEHVHADPNHRWSKEPFHYTPDYYADFLARLQVVLDGLD